jgi:hypothetical protein
VTEPTTAPPTPPPAKSRLADLGPAWITAIATLIAALAAAGVFAAHAASDNSNGSHPPAAMATHAPSPPAAQTSNPPLTASAAPTKLWTKSIEISYYYGLIIGPTASRPVYYIAVPAPDFAIQGLVVLAHAGHLFDTRADNPTYADCASSTAVANDIGVANGVAFCWVGPGYVVAAVIGDVTSDDVTMELTVWRGTPPS